MTHGYEFFLEYDFVDLDINYFGDEFEYDFGDNYDY